MRKLLKRPLQIYLDPPQDRALRRLAGQSGASVAEIVRKSIDRYLAEAVPPGQDPSLGLIGLGRSGRSDLAEQHDHVIATQIHE